MFSRYLKRPAPAPVPTAEPIATQSGSLGDPVIDEIAAMMNPYQPDLNEVQPELEAFNQVMAQKAQDTAELEETDKILKDLIELDKKSKTAQTNIHENIAKHRQFLAQNATKLLGVNLDHVIAMSGQRREASVKVGTASGIAAARSAIAARVRGGGNAV